MVMKLTVALVLTLGLLYVKAAVLTLNLLTDEPQETGAMCLDGSPPGYYMRAGSGDGANKWIVHLMGGAWCTSTDDCHTRSSTILGSTTPWEETTELFGIFSDDAQVNPDFYNWNGIFVIYCDGGCFAANREDTELYKDKTLYYRGYRILQAIIRHLNTEKGMSSATDIILTGCSAGGLAVLLHADFVQTLISPSAKYKALPDAGYFIDTPDIYGINSWPNDLTRALKLHNMSDAIAQDCREDNSESLWRCLIGPFIYPYIKTPLYVVNSQYDSIILEGSFLIPCTPPACTERGYDFLRQYKAAFDYQVGPVLSSGPQNGYFFDSCYIHCQTYDDDIFWTEVTINGVSMATSIGDWYFERSTNTRLKDCDTEFPCNPTCPNLGTKTTKKPPKLHFSFNPSSLYRDEI